MYGLLYAAVKGFLSCVGELLQCSEVNSRCAPAPGCLQMFAVLSIWCVGLKTVSNSNEKHHFMLIILCLFIFMLYKQTWSILPSGSHQDKSILMF